MPGFFHGHSLPSALFEFQPALDVKPPLKPLCLRLLSLSLPFILCACATSQRAVLDTIQEVREGKTAADRATLSPQLRYLRVTIEGRSALMVLGYIDTDSSGPIDVWYSAEGEVLRLQNGRLKGTAGFIEDWRETRFISAPSWQALPAHPHTTAHQWRRVRDVMPGYRFGIEDPLTVRPIAPPKSALKGLAADSLIWFEETRGSREGEALEEAHLLPPARYALRPGDDAPLYGEQCLTRSRCLAWQTWPAPPTAKVAP
jgi:hypothetical protein